MGAAEEAAEAVEAGEWAVEEAFEKKDPRPKSLVSSEEPIISLSILQDTNIFVLFPIFQRLARYLMTANPS